MQTAGIETFELDAQGREGMVLDIALPVLAAWSQSTRVMGFRPSMGVSGLSPREAARLRTLSLATGSRATGIFEGANDFRLGFRPESEFAPVPSSPGVEADLDGHPLAPVTSDLALAAFGLPAGKTLTHCLQGLTHTRGGQGQGYGFTALRALGSELGLELGVELESLGFEPHGLGRVVMTAARVKPPSLRAVDWKDRGELTSVRVVIGGVRPRPAQVDRIEAELKETFWEERRIEPVIERLATAGGDVGAFLEIEVVCDRGGASFTEMVARVSSPLPLARRAARRALGFLDSPATCDEQTGIRILAAAAAAGAPLEIALAPSEAIAAACGLLRDLGARLDEEPAPGLVMVRLAAAFE